MRKIYLVGAILLLALGVFLAGCGSQKQSAPSDTGKTSQSVENNKQQEKKTYTIAFVPGITTDAFYISMKKGAENAAKELGVNLIWQGPAQWDYTKQVPIVESFLSKKPDFMIIAPCSTDALIEPLKKVKEAGIPIITVDTNIKDESLIIANVTSDNKQGGQAAADALAKLIGGEGEVALINTIPGVTTTDDRQNGFLEQIQSKYPKIKVVSKQYCNDQQNTAAAQIQNIVLANPNLKGVFATNVVSSLGVVQGLKAKNLIGKIKVVEYDAGPSQVESLKTGEVQALIAQKPYAEGYQSVKMAVDYLNGKKDLEKHVLLPAVIATQENMNDPEVNKWFYKE
ncbi:substrate-binding domain-containing protein [Moorella naiadis]|uniref:ABC transporter substrate-binding protein n=1 Tax=Moorella naiadis (nom. illeg.) TaxID=3093670 RepID=UPI003D9CA36E